MSEKSDQKLFLAALVVALEERGGSVTFTDDDYQAIKRKYGGANGFVLKAEVSQPALGSPNVIVRLVNRQPGTARPT